MRRLPPRPATRKPLLSIALASLIIILAASVGPVRATPRTAPSQDPHAATAPAYEYEAVSVKPVNSARPPRGSTVVPIAFTTTPNGFIARATPLEILIKLAYGILNDEQLSGVPGWTHFQTYDIDARMGASVANALHKLAPDERKLARQQMLQALLAKYFHLSVHRETKELPAYVLTIVKNGPRLEPAKLSLPSSNGINAATSQTQPNAARWRQGAGPSMDGVTVTARAVSIEYLARELSQQVRREVVDETGLAGNYDFTLRFTPQQRALGGMMAPIDDLPSSSSGIQEQRTQRGWQVPSDAAPPIFVAIQAQLGLRLESKKAPVEVTVIDHVERPPHK